MHVINSMIVHMHHPTAAAFLGTSVQRCSVKVPPYSSCVRNRQTCQACRGRGGGGGRGCPGVLDKLKGFQAGVRGVKKGCQTG